MRVYEGAHIGDFYADLVADCWEQGALLVPRGKPNRELRPVTLTTLSWGELDQAGVSYTFATAEALAYLCGWGDVRWLARFRPEIARFSDDGESFYGAYGKRLYLQLPLALKKLQEDRDSRQVVLNIWHAGDLGMASNDLPCNTQLHLKIRKNRLQMLVVRRSADAVWGVPYDHHAWWFLLTSLAACLGLQPGGLTEVLDSCHVYEPDAGFYDVKRVERAYGATHRERLTPWRPALNADLVELRAVGEVIRAAVEQERPLHALPEVTQMVTFLLKGVKKA